MNGQVPPVNISLERVYEGIIEVKALVTSADTRLRMLDATVSRLETMVSRLDGTVHRLDREMAVLNDWRNTQVNHAIQDVGDLKVQLAKMAAGGGGFGLVVAAIIAILKATGVL